MLTADLLTRLAKACGANPNASVIAGIVANERYLVEGGINTPLRLAEFLAQACLETDYFKTLREYWGPTAAQKGYEGRKDLGNTQPGDGKRFAGRGIFQLTGRSNYATYGKRLGVDLAASPDLAAQPDISVRAAVLYWNDRGLNKYADAKNTSAISRAINRGSATAKSPANHEADRIKIASIARSILAAVPAAPPATVSPPPATPVAPKVEPAPTPAPEAPVTASPPPTPVPPEASPAAKSPSFFARFLSALLSRLKGSA